MTPTDGNNRKNAPALVHIGRTIQGLFLWNYDRGSWQYDLMVVLILIFVFLTPVHWFDDKPDLFTVTLGPDGGHYRVRARLLRRYDADFRRDPLPAAKRYFSEYLDHPFTIANIEEVPAKSDEAVWYDVWLQKEK